MELKTELVRSIRRQQDGTVKINITVKVGESFILADTITIIDFKEILSDSRIHEINLIHGNI